MKITLYTKTIEQAITDDDNLTAEDIEMVEDKMNDYIDFLIEDLEGNGDKVTKEQEANTPGAIYHAEDDDGQLVDIDIVEFWAWAN